MWKQRSCSDTFGCSPHYWWYHPGLSRYCIDTIHKIWCSIEVGKTHTRHILVANCETSQHNWFSSASLVIIAATARRLYGLFLLLWSRWSWQVRRNGNRRTSTRRDWAKCDRTTQSVPGMEECLQQISVWACCSWLLLWGSGCDDRPLVSAPWQWHSDTFNEKIPLKCWSDRKVMSPNDDWPSPTKMQDFCHGPKKDQTKNSMAVTGWKLEIHSLVFQIHLLSVCCAWTWAGEPQLHTVSASAPPFSQKSNDWMNNATDTLPLGTNIWWCQFLSSLWRVPWGCCHAIGDNSHLLAVRQTHIQPQPTHTACRFCGTMHACEVTEDWNLCWKTASWSCCNCSWCQFECAMWKANLHAQPEWANELKSSVLSNLPHENSIKRTLLALKLPWITPWGSLLPCLTVNAYKVIVFLSRLKAIWLNCMKSHGSQSNSELPSQDHLELVTVEPRKPNKKNTPLWLRSSDPHYDVLRQQSIYHPVVATHFSRGCNECNEACVSFIIMF